VVYGSKIKGDFLHCDTAASIFLILFLQDAYHFGQRKTKCGRGREKNAKEFKVERSCNLRCYYSLPMEKRLKNSSCRWYLKYI